MARLRSLIRPVLLPASWAQTAVGEAHQPKLSARYLPIDLY